MTRNLRILVAYDGAKFFGWQRQDGFDSVQQALEDAIEALIGEPATVRGSGRTDTGVHALGQVANVHLDTHLDDNRLWHALNAHLREGVTVRSLRTAEPGFHAQRSARGKRYAYVIEQGRFRSPFGAGRAAFVRGDLDVEAMRRGAAHLVGEHDFTSLASAGSPRASNVRRIHGLHLVPRRDGLAIVVGGNGFLYNMVRAIAGTLLDVGRGRIEPGAVREILDSKDRTLAGPTAPARGLWLVRVGYPEPVFPGRLRGPRGPAGLFDY